MLVIDDSKLNLLKMKEKMLELIDERSSILKDYRDLAIQIDYECYQMLIDEIKNSNYNNLPFEKQITTLRSILDDYNYLNEIQWTFRNTYGKYSKEELLLSDLSIILVDDIETRISQIEGYLMNNKNLKSNKMELDRLNQSLIVAVDCKKSVQETIDEIHKKLKEEVLGARGRKRSEDGKSEATDIATELNSFGIDLHAIIDDNELLDRTYSEALKERNEKQETLDTARGLPNSDAEICSMYARDVLNANYKIVLVELIKEVFNNPDDYYLFKDSLYKIDDLIKEINNNLKELRINMEINPFKQIKIKNYIKIFEKCKDYDINIKNITNTMTYLTDMVGNMEKANNDFLLSIGSDAMILKEDINTLYLNIPEEKENEVSIDFLDAKKGKANQVVKIVKSGANFMRGRAKEKTTSVIKRVYEMFCQPVKDEAVPELVIEKHEDVVEPVIEETTEENIDVFQELPPFVEPTLYETRKDDDIFVDNSKKMHVDLTNNRVKNELREKIDKTEIERPTEEETMQFWTPANNNNMDSQAPLGAV